MKSLNVGMELGLEHSNCMVAVDVAVSWPDAKIGVLLFAATLFPLFFGIDRWNKVVYGYMKGCRLPFSPKNKCIQLLCRHPIVGSDSPISLRHKADV